MDFSRKTLLLHRLPINALPNFTLDAPSCVIYNLCVDSSVGRAKVRVQIHARSLTPNLALQVWIAGRSRRRARWSSHPDMIKQYANCLARKLRNHEGLNISEPAIYFDIWRSMNGRFQQRMFDPRVDMVKAPWSPFKHTEWVLPLMIDFSPWRTKLDEIEMEASKTNKYSEVVFVADFPGLNLENFVKADLSASITVLEGRVIVEQGGHNVSLGKNEVHVVQSNDTHIVHTVSQTPSCWMYMYTNVTLANNVTLQHIEDELRSKYLGPVSRLYIRKSDNTI